MPTYEIYERKAWVVIEPHKENVIVQVMDGEGIAVLNLEETRKLAYMLLSAAYDVELKRK